MWRKKFEEELLACSSWTSMRSFDILLLLCLARKMDSCTPSETLKLSDRILIFLSVCSRIAFCRSSCQSQRRVAALTCEWRLQSSTDVDNQTVLEHGQLKLHGSVPGPRGIWGSGIL